jgi:hypothetical protein
MAYDDSKSGTWKDAWKALKEDPCRYVGMFTIITAMYALAPILVMAVWWVLVKIVHLAVFLFTAGYR